MSFNNNNLKSEMKEYDYHQRRLINGIRGTENILTMSIYGPTDIPFIRKYCKEHNLKRPFPNWF
jgi:hypothetical protein